MEQYSVDQTPAKNTFRIFYLGDSNTQGVVDYGDKMVDLVEQKLNMHYQHSEVRFEVINTGTSSYSILQYYLLSKIIIPPYSPDLVVINVDMTDVVNDCVYRQTSVLDDRFLPKAIKADGTNLLMTPHGARAIPIPIRFDSFLNHYSAAYRELSRIVRENQDKYFNLVANSHLCAIDWLTDPWDDETKKNVEYSMFVLTNTIKLLLEQDISIVVTGVPHFPQYALGYWNMNDPDALPPHPKHGVGPWSTKPHDYLRLTTESAGGLFLNSFDALKPYMINAKQTDYYYSNDPTHFNVAGNSIWADAQFRFLLDSGILP
jgi:lysophospholipase L1-like esterase